MTKNVRFIHFYSMHKPKDQPDCNWFFFCMACPWL